MDIFYVRNDITGEYLSGITVSRKSTYVSHQLFWVNIPSIALHFSELDEAHGVICFISDVLAWELADDLFVVSSADLLGN